MLKLKKTSNERVYYEDDQEHLHCFQKTGQRTFKFYRCSASGELLEEVPLEGMPLDYLPAGDSLIAVNFRAWIAADAWLSEVEGS